jgi:8-oxo-dGTP diphosphatase
VVWRKGAAAVEVLLVHRPRYDDWSFPKGKLEPGERFKDGARREVLEETGLEVELGPRLGDVRYLDRFGRRKVVRYWAMSISGGAPDFEPNHEVDRVSWLPVRAAAGRLTYQHDVAVLQAFAHAGEVEN